MIGLGLHQRRTRHDGNRCYITARESQTLPGPAVSAVVIGTPAAHIQLVEWFVRPRLSGE
jgi:hypothetical protein